MTPFTAMAMSVATYAGTAQLAALQLLAAGAPLAVIFFAALVLNLRFALYSLSMAPHFRSSTTPAQVALLLPPFGQRLRALHHPVRQPSGRVGQGRLLPRRVQRRSGPSGRRPPPSGVAVGAGIPAAWRLEFTVTLTFFALGISVIRDKAMAVAAATAAVTAVLAMGLPYRLGLIVAAAAGIAAGLRCGTMDPLTAWLLIAGLAVTSFAHAGRIHPLSGAPAHPCCGAAWTAVRSGGGLRRAGRPGHRLRRRRPAPRGSTTRSSWPRSWRGRSRGGPATPWRRSSRGWSRSTWRNGSSFRDFPREPGRATSL